MSARLTPWINFALVLVIAACLAWLSTHHGFVADWTRDSRASLPPAAQQLLAQLDGPVAVTSYASPGSGLRPTVAAFVARYQRFKPDLTLAFVDPERDPAAMRAAGIQVDGELTLTWDGNTRHLTELSDGAFTSTLARLARGGERIVAFVGGDGERRPAGKANHDLGQFMVPLEARGLRAVPLHFAQVVGVPEDTDLVVLASPLVALGAGAVTALVDWVEGGGNLLWLTEPDSRDLGLAPLADALGIRPLPGILVDGAGAALGLDDPRVIVTGTYPEHAITRGFALTTLFPRVVALGAVSASGWDAQAILSSGPQSWNELQPVDESSPSTIAHDAAAGELRGPLDFGFALSRPGPAAQAPEQRAVVLGDGDFLGNSFLGNGGNAALGERIFDWLLGDDALVTLPPRPAPDRQLDLSQAGLNALAFGLLLGLPLLILLTTGLLFWRRRRR